MTHVWRSDLGDRVRGLNNAPVVPGARYVLAWVQQSYRAWDNPLLDAAVDLGDALGLPVLVYHGLRQDYPYASDRLHRFILGAARDFQADCAARGLRVVGHVERPGCVEKGLVYRLAGDAAAILTDDLPVFVAREQADRVAARLDRAVYAVDTARLVPTRVLPGGLNGTAAFRKAHGKLKAEYAGAEADFATEGPAYDGKVCFQNDDLTVLDDAELDALVASCEIDHALPAVAEFPASRKVALAQVARFVAEDLDGYAARRNNPADEAGVSRISPYLHFGVLGPREVFKAVEASEAGSKARWKYCDELLTWREWFHYKAWHTPDIERFDALVARARETLLTHAGDERPVLHRMENLMHGRTGDETWDAAQRQWLVTGYMHNNLRMYWGKQLIKWTAHPHEAWQVACYLNDRLSLDGRDAATYGNMRWVFGETKPGWEELPIYGWVVPKSDGALRSREGFDAWAARWANVDVPEVDVGDFDAVKERY